MRIARIKTDAPGARHGFTLMEIMIVVAIIIILMTFTVPNTLRSRIAANDTAAIANLKVLNNACQLYQLNEEAYPGELAALNIAEPPYIDSALGNGSKQGYQFIYASVDADHFTVNANPTHTGLLKGRYFYLDETGVIRFTSDAPAGPDDQAIE